MTNRFRSIKRKRLAEAGRRQAGGEASVVARLATSVKIGFAISVISAVASAYAAWQTAEQAKYAQQALTASDLNHGFETFYDQWSALCDTIDTTDGYVVFDAGSIQDHQMIVVTATDLGFAFDPVDQASLRRKSIKAMDNVVAAHDKLAMWLPRETLATMRFDQVITTMILFSRVSSSEPEARHYSAMLREVGYCRLWKSWFMTWFKEGYLPTPNIYYKDVRLVFNARDGGLLDDEYIRRSRDLPWGEIHQYAPP